MSDEHDVALDQRSELAERSAVRERWTVSETPAGFLLKVSTRFLLGCVTKRCRL